MQDRQSVIGNRQFDTAEGTLTQTSTRKLIEVSELNRLSEKTGSLHRVRAAQPNADVMEGRFFYQELSDGIAIHGADVRELQDLENSIELKPGVSFNLVFSGCIEFSIGGQRFQIANHKGGAECSALLMSRPEVMTRTLSEGRKVRKLNVSVSYEWLRHRARNSRQFSDFDRIFQSSPQVMSWRADDAQVQLAKKLMAIDWQREFDLEHQLRVESMTMNLVGTCLESLLSNIRMQNHTVEAVRAESAGLEWRLKQVIDQRLQEDCSLAVLAKALNTSVSTLQRQAKSALGMTVIEYVRLRRLDLAKRALAVEGLSIGEAAYLAGYSHVSNFQLAFKRQYGLTPSELKRAHSSRTRP